MKQRVLLAGLAALAALSLAATGCESTPSTPSAGATTVSPLDALAAAAAKTSGQSFKFTIKYGSVLSGSGVQDGTGKNARLDLDITNSGTGVTLKTNVLLVGADAYLKVDFGLLGTSVPGLDQVGDRWMRLNSTKLGGAGALGLSPGKDILSGAALIRGVTTVERVSDTEFKGTIDLSKSVLPFTASGSKTSSKTVPFTAGIDDAGRLVKLAIALPTTETLGGGALETGYSDFGVATEVAKPAKADTVEAPAMLYQFLQ